MKWIFGYLLFLTLASCSTTETVKDHTADLVIKEVTPNKYSAIMKQNMLHLAQVYDLSPFLYTKVIHIESMVVPHSHPVLTLNTRNAENPKKILATWLHEEFHWWLALRPKGTSLAVAELKKIYPNAPSTQGLNPDSTYLHLIICYLEKKVLSFYLGEKEAVSIITEFMKKDKIYPWVYYQVLNKDFAIKQIISKYKLLPQPLI